MDAQVVNSLEVILARTTEFERLVAENNRRLKLIEERLAELADEEAGVAVRR